MDVIEFLGNTQKKNIKNSIQQRIQEKLKDYEKNLKRRQRRLRDLLEADYIQYNEEILWLINERVKESFQKRIEWLNTQRLERERAEEYQEYYESKLRHVISGLDQEKNQKISQEFKEMCLLQSNQLKQESQAESQRFAQLDARKRKDEKLLDVMKKQQQTKELEQQILENSQREYCLKRNELTEDLKQQFVDNQELLNDLQEREKEKIRNNEWHKCYLAYCLNEKRDKIREEAEFNELYRGTGCVLVANKKQPYSKAVRSILPHMLSKKYRESSFSENFRLTAQEVKCLSISRSHYTIRPLSKASKVTMVVNA
uniref:Trichohyalin-plectin-homology domain-containing protein n=1 Tax=Glossina palpalis gambiensis TaxID=67801 RepID=A0A1B0B072_9MUSC